ncbi:hypothetical protein GUITHDRAFT_150099 [Guillardia theta CCMP2712]|uniref:Thioredoxin domain-containing protein n=2 Tax=Guillardia theta TaxID=55529 RepID=L1K0Q4_GUITC|nr:hypothetical protein GUITHDRAFT_150099 [Guillardia theta CCMP2712]EKX53943.1 hypothetical protein GUITHDRAFT_150099 [Guillardia theta CCMP2712]|eukprot:XP_005840923.1 hypothetical protein GUITHDRAFT_150099 [Guillardia theta CCMP2712]
MASMIEAQAQAALEQHLTNVASAIESTLDEQIKKLDDMDEDDLDRLREVRLQQLKKQNEQKAEWRRKGHGKYEELSEEKEFFAASKASENVICHFYRPSTHRCAIVDRHLAQIANDHVEARFVRLNAEKCPFLVEKLRIVVLPTIALIKNTKTLDYIVGFDDLGGQDDFPTSVLEWRIACQGIIKVDYDVHEGPPSGLNPKGGRKLATARAGIWQKHDESSGEDDD